MSAKPATSVHLSYTMPQFTAGEVKSAEFHNQVKVEQSAKCTYFSVIQFYNGGYCGIQQRESDKIAIFSLWNDDQGKHDAELVSKHQRAIVEPFGGEGTGLKCICPFPWEVAMLGYCLIVTLFVKFLELELQSLKISKIIPENRRKITGGFWWYPICPCRDEYKNMFVFECFFSGIFSPLVFFFSLS